MPELNSLRINKNNGMNNKNKKISKKRNKNNLKKIPTQDKLQN